MALPRVTVRAKKLLIFLHRWLGTAMCFFFFMWFVSGIVMMYCSYPRVTPADRMNRRSSLSASQLKLSAVEAFRKITSQSVADEVTLTTFNGRPIYRFRIGGERQIVFGDDGTTLKEVSADSARREALSWTRPPRDQSRVELLTQEDQWTVSGSFRPLRPLYKVLWTNGDEVYVSKKTGEVVQATTRASRLGAYFGAIPHWLYFTPLRKNSRLWTRVVIWLSGLATLGSLIGIVVGAWMYSPSKRYLYSGAASRIPYRGQKRLHTILGLLFGVVACTWSFSGMMSMDPFPLGGETSFQGILKIQTALRGGKIYLDRYSSLDVRDLIRQVSSRIDVKEIEFTNFGGGPVYLVHGPANQSIVAFPGNRLVADGFDPHRLIDSVRAAVKPTAVAQTRLVSGYELYYVDRHHDRPLPVVFIQLDDVEHTMYFVDPKNARIVEAYDSGSRWSRWLFQGLHSMDLPWLYRYRPLWDILLLSLLAGGTWLSITSIVLAVRVLGRVISGRAPNPMRS
jgi:hypothetical protein